MHKARQDRDYKAKEIISQRKSNRMLGKTHIYLNVKELRSKSTEEISGR